MRTFKLALMAASMAAAAGILATVPANAALPTPLPRPTIGPIQQITCPHNGYIALKVDGPTSVKIGDSVKLSVTINPVNCDLHDAQIGMALGGGLTGDGLHQIGYNYAADTPITLQAGARAVQSGTWTYTAVAGGWASGSTDPQDSSCVADLSYGGWRCYRSAQTNLSITVTSPASPRPTSGSSTSQSGSSGGSHGQASGASAGSTQPALGGSAALANPLATFGGTRAGTSTSALNPALLIGMLALLVIVTGGAGIVLIRRALARRQGD